MAAHPCEGIMLDTPFQYATGQDAQALEVLEGIRTDHPGQIVMLNFGDLFTWAQPTGTTKTTVASSYTYQFPQVAFDVDPSGTTLGDPSNYNTRLSLLTSTLNARSLAGKHVTLGFYDAGGAHAQIAEDIMTTCSAYSNTSMYYATVSFSNTMPLRQWQWNEALPEPVATQLVYPIGTSDVAPYTGDQYPNGHEWTPSSGGNGHHLLLDEVTPNETDKITVAGFSGGKVERIVMDNGGTDIVLVTSYRVSLHLNSSAIANAPALRARFYVNHVEKDMREFECDTGGSWDDIEYTINGLYIDAAEWYAGPIEVELTPINGDAGYLPAS
jgi:hypothetical protein